MGSRIKYRDGYKYQLTEGYVDQVSIFPENHIATNFIILSPEGVLIIKNGYAWNGPSGPTFDTKNFMRGSLVHDALYQLFQEGLLSLHWREQADKELVRICRADGMSAIRAWWVYRAVRDFGGLFTTATEIKEAP